MTTQQHPRKTKSIAK
jgi:hypothetical protein